MRSGREDLNLHDLAATGARDSSGSCLPPGWILAPVNRQDHDLVVVAAKVDGVGKVGLYSPPDLTVHARKRHRVRQEPIEGIKGGREAASQTVAARLIPRTRFQCLRFRLGAEDHIGGQGQPNNLRRTSDQGTADAGFRRCSAQRRSSSARCWPVSSNAPSRSASLRLSQRAIAISARSSAGSFSRSVNGFTVMYRSSHGFDGADKTAPASSASSLAV